MAGPGPRCTRRTLGRTPFPLFGSPRNGSLWWLRILAPPSPLSMHADLVPSRRVPCPLVGLSRTGAACGTDATTSPVTGLEWAAISTEFIVLEPSVSPLLRPGSWRDSFSESSYRTPIRGLCEPLSSCQIQGRQPGGSRLQNQGSGYELRRLGRNGTT